MFNAQIKNVILSTLTATLIATSMSPAIAGDGGGDRAGQTVSKAPASSLPAEAYKPRPLNVAPGTVWTQVFFPGPMPGSRINDR